jgi:dynein heavy chain
MVDETAILDTGSGRWTSPQLEGGRPPCPRSDTCLAYDAKGSRLIVFGGWSDHWHNDLYTLDVGNIVGPPYAITDMLPKMGPITGGTNITIAGIDFINTTDVVVRFGNRRQSVDVKGVFVNQAKITCVSPDYTKFAPGVVDVRIALDGDSFTTTFQKFTYFSITNAGNSLMFGPGLLSGCAVNEEVSFIIQSRDNESKNRTTGGDEYVVTINLIGGGEDGDDLKIQGVKIDDKENGQYVVSYVARHAGKYNIDVLFMGTFGGEIMNVRGSGVTITFDEFAPRDNNLMAGEVVTDALKKDVLHLEEFTNKISDAIFVKIKTDGSGEDQIRQLMSIRENLLVVESKTSEINLIVDRSEAIVQYLKEKQVVIPNIDVILSTAKVLWEKILREAPQIQNKISPMMRSHASKIRGDIAAYEAHVTAYREELKKSKFIFFVTGPFKSLDLLDAADEMHKTETLNCEKMVHIAKIFESTNEIAASIAIIADVAEILKEYRALWECVKNIMNVIDDARRITWAALDPESFEDSAKSLVQSLRRLSKNVKSSDSFKGADKLVKEFLSTCPLIISLRSPAMRERHWRELMDVVKREFTLPAKNPKMLLKDLLDLELHLHANDVEEITDKASKEAKHETTLANLETTWAAINFSMTWYKDTDVPLLKLDDELIEQLESDQMAVQSIVGSRYAHFKQGAIEWQKSLGAVSDIVLLLVELQRTWSYLEPLFIGSEEVKKELPEDAKRFQEVDSQVRNFLQKSWKTQNVKAVCSQGGLLDKLTAISEKQEKCRKSLSEFLDGKRRQFPRFYFMSEADLLDVLSNSSQPVKVLKQIDKILLATKELTLNAPSGGNRPSAVSFIAGVGKEVVKFDAPVKLDGKAEAYLLSCLQAQIYALSRCLTTSVNRYPEEPRVKWMMKKDSSGESVDPAQIILLVASIDFTQSVEKALKMYSEGDKKSVMKCFDMIKTQLSELISLTQSALSKGDRQRVMCMITLDAHNRDVVDVLIRENALAVNDFQWQSKLRPKYMVETKSNALTASIARFYICDAKFDYGFEYLGNGPRLVITPLTDRIYVTATQALNLKMGCAPAGPAGTGKTESTKDLASALGKCCYVFNCSPEMDYRSMGDIFKGLAASGSWG